jgi:outer membrane protein
MRGPKGPMRPLRAGAAPCAVLALSLSAVHAADLTTQPATPAPAPPPVLPDLSGWYVRVGAVGTFPQSSSNLYSQALGAVSVPGGFVPVGVGPQVQIPGRGATYSNVFTVGFEGGYFFTPNWSVEVETGFPVWASVKINGNAPPGSPPAGTDLGGLMAGAIPITGVYHFRQFGGFQPYLGAGIAPTFALAVRDGYATGGSYQPTVGVVVQGGFDYMFNQHWGVFVDAKQGFVRTSGDSTGINLGPPLGIVSVVGSIKTNAKPVSFMTGVSYRF